MKTSPDAPTLLVVGSGSQQRNAQMLIDLSDRVPVALLQPGAVTWQRPYLRDHSEIDPADVESTVAAAKAMVGRHHIGAVVGYEEALLPLVGVIGDRLGLPGLPVAAAGVVRDKHAQRCALDGGWPRPTRSVLVHDVGDGEAVATDLGYPVVIKPRSLSGSLGVTVAADARDFRRLLATTKATDPHGMRLLDGVLVEEYLDGPEFSVDCWVLDGHAETLFMALIVKGYPPHAINTRCVVGPGIATPDQAETVSRAACAAALRCGLDRTIANVDIRWTASEPRVLEVNGRPAGELLPHLAHLSSGLRMGHLLADVAMGRRPTRPPAEHRAAGVVFLAPPVALHFAGLRVPPGLANQEWLEQIREIPARGDHVIPPPEDPWGRAGWAVATGPDAVVVLDRLDQLRDGIEVLPQNRVSEGS